jgi:hypothetical protein
MFFFFSFLTLFVATQNVSVAYTHNAFSLSPPYEHGLYSLFFAIIRELLQKADQNAECTSQTGGIHQKSPMIYENPMNLQKKCDTIRYERAQKTIVRDNYKLGSTLLSDLPKRTTINEGRRTRKKKHAIVQKELSGDMDESERFII